MQQLPNGGKPFDQGTSTAITIKQATFHDIPSESTSSQHRILVLNI